MKYLPKRGKDTEYQYLMVILNHLVSSFVCNGWAIHHHFMYESVNPLTNQERSVPRGTSPLQPPLQTTWSKGPGKQNEWLWLQGVESLTTVTGFSTPNFWGGAFIFYPSIIHSPPSSRIGIICRWEILLVLLFKHPLQDDTGRMKQILEGERSDKSLTFDKVYSPDPPPLSKHL